MAREVSKGSIVTKKINGKQYYYHVYYLDGRQKAISIDYYDAIDKSILIDKGEDVLNHDYFTDVLLGSSLAKKIQGVRSYKKRDQFDALSDYLNGNSYGKTVALYGLRRSGKTTLMMQSIAEMRLQDISSAAYIRVNGKDSIDTLCKDLDFLLDHGFKYVFIDEITLLADFIASSAVLSDIYALQAKIVLSGTDSLGFLIASHNELYDRVKLIHTTRIPFKEYCRVLGKNSIDEYISYGGTMSMEGIDYNATILRNGERLNEYVDSSIAHNILHSLRLYEDGSRFSSLERLYASGELLNVINRIVEDANHRFLLDIIDRDFKSHDFGSLKQLVQKDINHRDIAEIFKNIDGEAIAQALKESLDILNKNERSLDVAEACLIEVKEYLKMLDLFAPYEVVTLPASGKKEGMAITQPGLRYAQAKTLLGILMDTFPIASMNDRDRDYIRLKLESDIKGKMLEEIVLSETYMKYGEGNCFKLMFPIGEFDMVVLNREESFADIFEIKYAKVIDSSQYRFLIDKEKCATFEEKYYPIRHRYVLYRGEDCEVDGVMYRNVEGYLKTL